MTEDDLIGAWAVSFSSNQDGVSISMTGDETFYANGTSNFMGEVVFSSPENDLSCSVVLIGTWILNDSVLATKITKMRLVPFPGQEINQDVSEYLEAMTQAMEGTQANNKIISFDGDRLILEEESIGDTIVYEKK